MAYLNVRERRIEAKIAYVGPGQAGKATNFDHLMQSAQASRIGKLEAITGGADDLPTLSWLLRDGGRFRDCDVHVKVVAQRGAFSDDRVHALLNDADGVVIVIDAHPSAQARNRASLDAVRDVLVRGERRHVPLVLQVNKSDLPDALSADAVVGGLEASSLTHVIASAARGEGVVETLEAALVEVLEAMRADRSLDAGEGQVVTPGVGEGATNPPAAMDGGHPLLAALRHVLRETVREHVDELESRIVVRLEASLGRIERRLEENDARVKGLAPAIAGAATKADLAPVTQRIDLTRDELKAELVRTTDVRARADREHLASTTASLKKAVDGVAAEMKASDARVVIAELVEIVDTVARRADHMVKRIDVAVDGVQSLPKRLDQVETSSNRIVRVEDALRTLRSELADNASTADGKTDAVYTRVNDIVEELKKTKKGWFT